MKTIHLPKIESRYWFLLIIASILGANIGDFFSDVLDFGHIAGLPILFGLFIVIILIEKFDTLTHDLYFWGAILIIRAAATNIGDVGHDLHVNGLVMIGLLSFILIVSMELWKKIFHQTEAPSSSFAAHPFYWWTMLVAGSLGTAIGDYCSFAFKLGNLNATFVLGTIVAILFFFGRNGKLRQFSYYWLTVVTIRSAGTAAGDFFAHKVFGLEVSTLVFAVGFSVLLLFFHLFCRQTAHNHHFN